MKWGYVAVAIGGVGLGLGLRTGLETFTQDQPASAFPTQTLEHAQPDSNGRILAIEARLAQQERELARLVAFDAGEPQRPPNSDARAILPQPLDREAVFRERDDELARFEREAIDPAWAGAKKAEIEKGLLAIQERGEIHFTSVVECKTNRCVARLLWPNFATAKKEFTLASPSPEDCTQRITLDEPIDESVPFEGRLIFGCRRE